MPVWPGDPPVVLQQISSIKQGANANVSRLDCGVHTGTHVDAPHHFLDDGRTIETLSLDVLVGPVLVIQIPDEMETITAEILNAGGIPAMTKRLLIRTRNSHLWEKGVREFDQKFVGISNDGAEWLVNAGMKLVGVDYLSVAPFHQSGPTHRTLLSAGIVIVEGLDLSKVVPGPYELYCLPLKLLGSDGAPARVILKQ